MTFNSILAGSVFALPLIGALPTHVPTATSVSDWFPAAQAADFTGRIKRVRIKRRRVGSGYRIRARTQPAQDSSTVSQQISIVGEDGFTIDGPEFRSTRTRSIASARVETVKFEKGLSVGVAYADGDMIGMAELFLTTKDFGQTFEIETPRGLLTLRLGQGETETVGLRVTGDAALMDSTLPVGNEKAGFRIEGQVVPFNDRTDIWTADVPLVEMGGLDGQPFNITTIIRDKAGTIIERRTERHPGDFDVDTPELPGAYIDQLRLRANKKGAVVAVLDTVEVMGDKAEPATVNATIAVTYEVSGTQDVLKATHGGTPVATSHVYFDPIPVEGDLPAKPGSTFANRLEIYSQTGKLLNVSEAVLTLDGGFESGAFEVSADCQYDRGVQAVADGGMDGVSDQVSKGGVPRLDIVLTSKGGGCDTPDLTPGTIKVENNGDLGVAIALKEVYGMAPKTEWQRNRFKTPNSRAELVEAGNIEIDVEVGQNDGPATDIYGSFGPGAFGKTRPPEPYKGKGTRYVGEIIRRKAGKAAAK